MNAHPSTRPDLRARVAALRSTLRPVAVTVLSTVALLGVGAAGASASTLFAPDYSAGLAPWQGTQQPAGTPRISIGTAPGVAGAQFRPAGNAMRVELRQGDVTNTGGYLSSRAEVYGRQPLRAASAPAATWPDPVGSIRWYSFDLYVPADFVPATDTKWLVLTQWKGFRGGSPPVDIEVRRSSLRLAGTNIPLTVGDLGPISPGQWTHLVVGMKLSPDPLVGWIEAYRDKVVKVPHLPVATMNEDSSGVDPIYLKQGIYRTSAWATTQVFWFGPMEVSSERADAF
jgi:hypothetical protein